MASFLPFFEVDDIDFFCALWGDGTQPCKRCHRDCLDTWLNCFQCYTCSKKFHSTIYDNAFCSKRCSTGIFPFSGTDYDSLVLDCIFTKNVDELTPEPSKVVTKMKEKVTKHVPIDHFYDIDYSYLNPNDLDDSHLSSQSAELSIFQGNVRSLNANFDCISEIFENFSKLPDVMAITETKLKKDDDEAEQLGYKFERSDRLVRDLLKPGNPVPAVPDLSY